LDPTVFALRSTVFGPEESIPAVYTCKGKDISPPLEWGAPPEGTQSLVLIAEDITGGANLVHWTIFNIPPAARSLPEGVPTKGHLDDGSQQGMNHIFELGYFGPCPMPGPNQYRFRLYALDTVLDLEDGVMKIPLKAAMKGHILAETEVIGLFP
jgi:Raf kinase inhibitor-like YbhB/YbcL family protein